MSTRRQQLAETLDAIRICEMFKDSTVIEPAPLGFKTQGERMTWQLAKLKERKAWIEQAIEDEIAEERECFEKLDAHLKEPLKRGEQLPWLREMGYDQIIINRKLVDR